MQPAIRRCVQSFLLSFLTASGLPVAARAANLSTDVRFGYLGGPGGETQVLLSEIAPAVPFDLSLGLGWAALAPGRAAEARRIFINNATNGTPEKRAWAWVYRLDASYAFRHPSGSGFRVFGGPRYARYTANFRYVGGNEDFDVRSRLWGLGGGLEEVFAIHPRSGLILSVGADYFFEAPLNGHDTTYRPDGESVNPREDFEYRDADAAIDQPGLELRFLAGVRIRGG